MKNLGNMLKQAQLAEEFPRFESSYGVMPGTLDLVPKPVGQVPVLITGSSRQSLEWIAAQADGGSPIRVRLRSRRSSPRAGARSWPNLLRFLEGLRAAGVHHVAFNFKYARRTAEELLDEIGGKVLPQLESSQSAAAYHAA